MCARNLARIWVRFLMEKGDSIVYVYTAVHGSSLLLPASAAAALAAALGPAAAVVVQLIVGRRRLPSAMAMGCSAASYPLSAALGA